jgi:hypothetical protein
MVSLPVPASKIPNRYSFVEEEGEVVDTHKDCRLSFLPQLLRISGLWAAVCERSTLPLSSILNQGGGTLGMGIGRTVKRWDNFYYFVVDAAYIYNSRGGGGHTTAIFKNGSRLIQNVVLYTFYSSIADPINLLV